MSASVEIATSSRATVTATARTFAVTFFTNYGASSKREGAHTLASLAKLVRATDAPKKADLPWLKLARFGESRTDKGSLRHDANMLAISGIEVDYDGGATSFAEAAEKLTKAGLMSLLYTSPSHTEDAPRWRVICPTSEELPPDRREHLVGRLNGLFSGGFASESWTRSQSYYFGSVGRNPSHQVEVVDGEPIDALDELDEIWIGKPDTASPAKAGSVGKSGAADEGALLAEITGGTSYHTAAVRLLGRWALDNVPLMDARARLIAAFDAVPESDRDARWKARRDDVDRCLMDIYGKEAKGRDEPTEGKKSRRKAPAATASETDAEADEWSQYLQRDDHGNAIPNLANAAHILRRAPAVVGLFAYDEMLRHSLLQKAIPGGRSEPLVEPRPMHDADVGVVQEWLQRHELRRLGKDVTHQAIDLVARENGFHPVREYLTGLIWDGTPRLLTWLHKYMGAEASDYHTGIGKMFLIAMVARIMRPGCKADYMPVFEGPQGARKSTACAILGGKWFSDSLPDLHQGDAVRLSMSLRGKWIVEIAEMSSISKAEAGALKAFLTQTEERYVPKYGRVEVIEPRQCVFIGTTNKTAYLRDETGGRRFWPVKIGIIKTDDLIRDRDQLFAEAMHVFAAGTPWWPTQAFEQEHIAPQQEARYEADAWEGAVAKFLEELPSDKKLVTVLDVARQCLFIDTPRLGTADQRRIAAAMERLGWRRGERTMTGRPWVPCHDA